ncbi:MAG: NAD+ synthase [Planctomycetes bacterium]|nr:NAD+ synthase [Planctomycetota bacterium]
MRAALAQLDPTVGDVAGNRRRIADAAESARKQGASLLLTGEMALLGYPPRDLVLRAGVAEACEKAVAELALQFPDLTMIIGTVRRVERAGRGLANSLAVCRKGKVETHYDKRLLPTYDVFDEDRYFSPGAGPLVVEHEGEKFGLLICEDLWVADDVSIPRNYSIDPVAETMKLGATALLVASASPFVLGKRARQRQRLVQIAKKFSVPIASCQQVGANDDLVFDGSGLCVDRAGNVAHAARLFEASLAVVDPKAAAAGKEPPPPGDESDLVGAIVCGIRGYFRKTGHTRATIGLSGGIDSALVACLAALAIGAANVTGIMMPSKYSSAGSVDDARELAKRLKLGKLLSLPIDAAHDLMAKRLKEGLGAFEGLPDENLQSRLRGLTSMSVSNSDGSLVLATGNKSELATGYATLYGDMVGGMAPIGDLLKTQVYALAKWINANFKSLGFAEAPIPQASIDKAPSAELRPDQTDQDSLPPYEDLDKIVTGWIEHEGDVAAIASITKLDPKLVERWCLAIDRAQFKRDQSPLVIKVAARTFGRGRPMPIAAQWRLA